MGDFDGGGFHFEVGFLIGLGELKTYPFLQPRCFTDVVPDDLVGSIKHSFVDFAIIIQRGDQPLANLDYFASP